VEVLGQSPRGNASACPGTLAPADLLAAIVNSSDDAIIGKTPDGVITTWNPAAEHMYGYTAAEIIGQPVTVLCPPDRVAEIQEILSKIRSGERVSYHESLRQRKDGTIFPVSVAVSPVWDDRHGLVGASSIARDISERYRIQAELRLRTADLECAYRDLETFSYSVSHDLRAPLRALDGLSNALLEDCGPSLSQAGLGYTRRIRAAAGQMTSLIEDLLNLARVSRAEVHPQMTDLGSEVARIAEEHQHQEPRRHVRFTIQRPVWAWADPTLIRTVLQNLMDNAWKFTSGRDEAAIEFGMTPDEISGNQFYLRDNGAGFDTAYAGKLFKPFQRLHSAAQFPGTGVGLASVRQIVERHGGRVWADGAPGAGATFYFTLPADGPEPADRSTRCPGRSGFSRGTAGQPDLGGSPR
jgi:PAS domain S-box-containing protein